MEVVSVKKLSEAYGNFIAVKNLNISVKKGKIIFSGTIKEAINTSPYEKF